MCNPYDPDPFEVVDVRGHRIATEREIPGMHRRGRVSKAETNLATPVNSFLEKEKKRMMYMQLVETQMLHRIRKKHRLRAVISQLHILLKRLHLSTFGIQPEKDDIQLGSKIIELELNS